MADLNYVSPLTSDLTDYYTKTEVDELQQGDAATYATSAQVQAGDNAVKNWVDNQGFLTQHQSLANYATKEYVNEAIGDIEVEGGVKIRVVNSLPVEAEENVIYLVRKQDTEEDNIYNEWIWVPASEDYELIGDTSTGVIPDLTDYATKTYVDTAVAGISVDAKDVAYDNQASGLEAGNVKNAIDEVYAAIPTMPVLAAVATSGDYLDLSNKPTIPYGANDISFGNYGTGLVATDAQAAILEVNAKVEAIDVPDVSGFVESSDLATVATSGSYNDLTDKPTIPAAPDLSSYATKSELSAKANAADLATVATSGSYNDLSNKPTIPSTSGLASETYVDDAIAAIDIPTKVSDLDNDSMFVDEGMAKAFAIDEINNNVSAAGLSGSYDDLDDKPTIPTVPTNVSSFTNDAGYLTSHQDISGKVDGTVVSGTTTAKIFNEADGGGAQIITASARGFAGVHDGSNPDATYATMYVKNAAGTSTLARVDLDGDGKAYYLKNGASKAAGSEIAVKGDIPDVSSFITSSDLPDLSGYAETANLATVATSGSYNDLINKPTIPSISGLATETYVDNAVADISVPANTSDLTNDSGFITSSDLPDTSGFVESSDLATVATSGDYDDLTNKPTIPVLPTLATVATSGSYNDLTNKPVIPTSDEVVGLDLFISGMFNNIGYNKTPYTVNPNNDSAAWLVDFKAGLDSGKWLFLNGPQGKTITASDLGVSDFSITTYNYDTNNTTRTEFNKGAGTTSWTFPSDNSGAANSGYFARTGRNTFFYVYGTNSNMKNYWLFKFLQSRLTYSNTTSGLTATTIQGAIDELAAASGSGSEVGWTYDSSTGYMTFTGMSDNNM